MADIADFDKPWTEMEKVPCVCGHARVFHGKTCEMAGCLKCKGFTPRPPEVPTITQFGALLEPRPDLCSCGQTVVNCRRGLKEWVAVNLDARKPTPHFVPLGTHTIS